MAVFSRELRTLTMRNRALHHDSMTVDRSLSNRKVIRCMID
jgi:hypothetical protein